MAIPIFIVTEAIENHKSGKSDVSFYSNGSLYNLRKYNKDNININNSFLNVKSQHSDIYIDLSNVTYLEEYHL